MAEPPRPRDDTPAWPLGCGVALLGLVLSFNIAGVVGILFAALTLPPWLGRAVPLLGWVLVPLLMLGGWALARRRNPYGGRVLLWGFALSLVFIAVATMVFDTISRLSGLP